MARREVGALRVRGDAVTAWRVRVRVDEDEDDGVVITVVFVGRLADLEESVRHELARTNRDPLTVLSVSLISDEVVIGDGK